MTIDITDDTLTPALKSGLEALHWRWDASAQAWRQYNDAGEWFSTHPLDHQRQFDVDVSRVLAASEKIIEPTGGELPAADNMRSEQVEHHTGHQIED